MPSMTNVYDSTYSDRVRDDEFQRGARRFAASQDPHRTGVVPQPAYASTFPPASQGYVQTLAGDTIPREQFTHANMEPFFGGRVTQNTDVSGPSPVLERYTGASALPYRPKEEVPCLFEPTGGYGNVNGMPGNAAYMTERIEAPKARNNVFPILPERVGPGLGQGFTTTPSGGFQQANTLAFAMPKTVDELRTATNQKATYQIPVQGPAQKTAQRGLVGEIAKNKPDTYYAQSSDQWLATTGAVIREAERPYVDLKPVARGESHVPYQGTAVATREGQGATDDYGKATVLVYDNERMTTQMRTVVTNLASVAKAIVAPLLDVFRHTPKEYTVDAARTFGVLQAQLPSKQTLYDSVNHIMRTTIKETTIHDTTILNPRGKDATEARTEDQAKTTVRETTGPVSTTRNVGGLVYRVQVYNTEEVAKTTIRETTSDASGSMYGFVSGGIDRSKGAYTHIPVELPPTEKQMVSDHSHVGTAAAQTTFVLPSEDAERNAEIDGTREALQMAAGYTPNAGGAYVGMSVQGIDVTTHKLMQDSMAAREDHNITRVMQQGAATLDSCSITKPQCLPNAQEGRLDPSVLNALKQNTFNLSVNPIGS